MTTGNTILSVTIVDPDIEPNQDMIDRVTAEVRHYTRATEVTYMHHYPITHALPDLQDLKMTVQPQTLEVMNNVFYAGDSQLNASLNAAMEAGKLAAEGIIKT